MEMKNERKKKRPKRNKIEARGVMNEKEANGGRYNECTIK